MLRTTSCGSSKSTQDRDGHARRDGAEAPAAFAIGTAEVAPGERRTVELPISVLSDHTPITMSVHVVHGRRPGPVLFVSAAVHGDEIQGVEIIRRLLRATALRRLRGTLLAIPVVNAYGFITHSRYLPDRRDLNRSFPGSERGSLAAQLADLFMREVVRRSEVGIDLHTASQHRTNLPQIRVAGPDGDVVALAKAFGAPVIVESGLREGSLRLAGREAQVPVLVYEAGEALRFEEMAIRAGTRGILRVMHHMGMITGKAHSRPPVASLHSRRSYWVRSPEGGILRWLPRLGGSVAADSVIGIVSDPFGEVETEILSRTAGIVIGRTNLPVVNRGDAVVHVAEVTRPKQAQAALKEMRGMLDADPMFDEDEII